jgi:hypothetical protein
MIYIKGPYICKDTVGGTMGFKVGDIVKFQQGNVEGLLGFITEVEVDSNNKTRIHYHVVGDGRLPGLQKNKVYQWYTFDTDGIMTTAIILPVATEDEHML